MTSVSTRPKGALKINTVNADREMMEKLMRKLSDAIEEKWPPNQRNKTIMIQMDNALPHITEDNQAWKDARSGGVMDVKLVRQPPQAPDLDVLDLGLWNLIQALQKKEPIMHTNFELVRCIEKCYKAVPLTTVDSCFVTLQNMLREVKDANGGNYFKTPRKRKYAPPQSDDEEAFFFSDSDTETEDEGDDGVQSGRARFYSPGAGGARTKWPLRSAGHTECRWAASTGGQRQRRRPARQSRAGQLYELWRRYFEGRDAVAA